MPGLALRLVAAVRLLVEHVLDLWMADRVAGIVFQQVLFRDIGDVFGLRILGQQVVKRLVLAWPDLGGNGLIPFFRVGELRVDVEDDAAEREQPMANLAVFMILTTRLSIVIWRSIGRNSILC